MEIGQISVINVFMEVVDVPDRGLYGGCRRT